MLNSVYMFSRLGIQYEDAIRPHEVEFREERQHAGNVTILFMPCGYGKVKSGSLKLDHCAAIVGVDAGQERSFGDALEARVKAAIVANPPSPDQGIFLMIQQVDDTMCTRHSYCYVAFE